MTKALLENSPRIPRSYLTVGFLSWKVLLFSVSLLSPCPGYDTSTTLLEGVGDSSLLPLIRWDAIYFTETAQRGYIFEQEWAFSWTLTRAMAFVAKCSWPRSIWIQLYWRVQIFNSLECRRSLLQHGPVYWSLTRHTFWRSCCYMNCRWESLDEARKAGVWLLSQLGYILSLQLGFSYPHLTQKVRLPSFISWEFFRTLKVFCVDATGRSWGVICCFCFPVLLLEWPPLSEAMVWSAASTLPTMLFEREVKLSKASSLWSELESSLS